MPLPPRTAPEKVLVFGSIRRQQTPVGGDHVRTDDVVDGQPILGVQVAPTAAERQTGDADGGDDTLRRGQTEGLRLTIKFPELEPVSARAVRRPGRRVCLSWPRDRS